MRHLRHYQVPEITERIPIERTLANSNVAYTGSSPGFGGVRLWDGIERFRHQTYLPDPKGDRESEIIATHVAKNKAYQTPN